MKKRYPYNSKRYTLDIVVHNLNNYFTSCWLLLTDPCELITIYEEEIEEIRQHVKYKGDCSHCMKK